MELEEYDVTDGKKLLDLRHPRPVSVLEPSLASESLMSSESTNSNWTEGNSINLFNLFCLVPKQ